MSQFFFTVAAGQHHQELGSNCAQSSHPVRRRTNKFKWISVRRRSNPPVHLHEDHSQQRRWTNTTEGDFSSLKHNIRNETFLLSNDDAPTSVAFSSNLDPLYETRFKGTFSNA